MNFADFIEAYKKISDLYLIFNKAEKKGLEPRLGLLFLDPKKRTYDNEIRDKIHILISEINGSGREGALADNTYKLIHPIRVRRKERYLKRIPF